MDRDEIENANNGLQDNVAAPQDNVANPQDNGAASQDNAPYDFFEYARLRGIARRSTENLRAYTRRRANDYRCPTCERVTCGDNDNVAAPQDNASYDFENLRLRMIARRGTDNLRAYTRRHL